MERLLSALRQRGLDGLYISRPENVRYISPYTGDEAWLLITEKDRFLLTDPRYTEQAALECPDYTIVEWRRHGSESAALGAIVRDHPYIQTIGYEGSYVTVNRYAAFQKDVPAQFVAADGIVEQLRKIKRPEEVECLRIASDIACRAFGRIVRDIRVGVTEKEIAARLHGYMVMEGADSHPYGGIVLSGARTSMLHGIPSSKAIEYGDLVLMDFGCQYHGYLSDMTRTVVVGKATPRQKEIYRLEREMVEEMLRVIKPGIACKDVYQRSIRPITDTEYFPYHYSGIGHGVGIFVHELPFISPTSEDVIEAGNVMTVEPGIYIPGWGGIRIEDQILITEDGYESLIVATKDLQEL